MIPPLVKRVAVKLRKRNKSLIDGVFLHREALEGLIPAWAAIRKHRVVHAPPVDRTAENWFHHPTGSLNERAAVAFLIEAVDMMTIHRSGKGKTKAERDWPEPIRKATVDAIISEMKVTAQAVDKFRRELLILPEDRGAFARVEEILTAHAADLERRVKSSPLVVDRVRNENADYFEKVLALKLSALAQQMFGRPLDEAVASMVAVVFGDYHDDADGKARISKDAIRNWRRQASHHVGVSE